MHIQLRRPLNICLKSSDTVPLSLFGVSLKFLYGENLRRLLKLGNAEVCIRYRMY